MVIAQQLPVAKLAISAIKSATSTGHLQFFNHLF
jgi:hypothetical protein